MESVMSTTTIDCKGLSVAPGDKIRILSITPDPDLDEDDLEMFMNMVGSRCEVERIDPDGTAWVVVWWNTSEGSLTTQAGLAPEQIEKLTV
jgi:hypothetical protein